jgi:hypothetical protein
MHQEWKEQDRGKLPLGRRHNQYRVNWMTLFNSQRKEEWQRISHLLRNCLT